MFLIQQNIRGGKRQAPDDGICNIRYRTKAHPV
jgi:hypothetical protein